MSRLSTLPPNFRPMLAAPLLDPEVEHTDDVVMAAMQKLKYPVYASLKMDGIRAIKSDYLVSRSLKLIPNIGILARATYLPVGLDMELWNPTLSFHEIESIVMSDNHGDHEKIMFYAIDWYAANVEYHYRIQETYLYAAKYGYVFHYPILCDNPYELFKFEKRCIEEQGEGICFREPKGKYKFGRSTLREQGLVKLARSIREEGTIIGFEEQLENRNRARRNDLGLMDRSSMKGRLRGKETLGAFVVQNDNGHVFKIGTGVGLTDELREEVWLNQDKYLNMRLTYKAKAHGKKIKPRCPVFVGFRRDV